MRISFDEYVLYRGRQFERLFRRKKKIIYITNRKRWLKVFPEDKKITLQRDGLAAENGYVFINPRIKEMDKLDKVILEEVTHVLNWKWGETKTRAYVSKILGN